MSGFTPVKQNISSSELQTTDHCEPGGSAHHLSAASHNYTSSQVDNKSQPQLTSTPQPSAAQISFSDSPAKSGHQDNSIIKPPDQFRSANEEQHSTMHENGYSNTGGTQSQQNRQMFQDGYHPQRHGMGPLSDSEFAFSNAKRIHRKRSLIGFDTGEAESFEVCALALTFLSIGLIVATLPFSLFFCIKVVQEYERAVIFRLGRLVTGGARGPGIFFIIPCIDTYTKVDLRTVSFDVPPQEILSKDSVTVAVDAVVYFRISNAIASVSNVEDYARSTRLLAATTLRNVLGTKNLSEILSERESISHMIQTSLDEATDSWGVKVERVEIKDVRLPVQLQRAMAAEAEAAREARAKVIAAEGEQRASRALREASEVITDSPAALQLRYLQTLNSIAAEKNSTIVFPVPMELFRGFLNNKHKDNHDHHGHDHHSHGYHHHHSNGVSNGNSHLHHSNSVEKNLALSTSNNPTSGGLQLAPSNNPTGIRKKSGSLIMEMSMQNPAYSADLNPEKRQDSIEKQIDNIHVDFGLEEMMTSV